MPFFVRHIDGDLLMFVHDGAGRIETEFGPLAYRKGDWVYMPKACTWRHLPDEPSTWLMIQANDEFRVPPPGQLGRHFPFDPSQAVIPDPQPCADGDGPQGVDRDRFHEALRDFLDLRGLKADWEAARRASDTVLVNSLSMMLPFPPSEKQALLEAPTLATRRETLAALMQFAIASGGEDGTTLQ